MKRAVACAGAALCLALASRTQAGADVASNGVGVDERIDAALPSGLVLRDQDDRMQPLASAFDGEHPVILQLAYYHCPMLCDLTLRELAGRLRELDWRIGRDYRALTVSIDPSDTRLGAGAKRENVLALLPGHPAGAWPFYVATAATVTALTNAVGYHYRYDERTREFAHPAVTVVLTPTGKVSRYLYGPITRVRDVRLALREARAGRASGSSLVDRVILSCFHYDPSTRRYALLIGGVMRGGAAVVALALALTIAGLVRRGRAAGTQCRPGAAR